MMKYRSGYKYQLAADFTTQTSITAGRDIKIEFIELTATGLLTGKSGYAWDGASGIAIDTKTIMRGSLVHDMLFQLLRMGLLDPVWFKPANEELRKVCIKAGMWKIRAGWVYNAVQKLGAFAADPANKKEVLTAP